MSRERFPARIARYEMPNPLRSSDNAERVRCGDLGGMDTPRLLAERIAASGAFAEAIRRSRAGRRVYLNNIDAPEGVEDASHRLLRRITAVDRELDTPSQSDGGAVR